jgi:hypothetical protein
MSMRLGTWVRNQIGEDATRWLNCPGYAWRQSSWRQRDSVVGMLFDVWHDSFKAKFPTTVSK